MAGERSTLDSLQAPAGAKVFRWAAGGAAQDYDYADPIEGHWEVLLIWTRNTTGTGGACTATFKNGTTAISNAIDVNQADNTVTMVGTIDDAAGASILTPDDSLTVTVSAAEDTFIACVLAIPYSA